MRCRASRPRLFLVSQISCNTLRAEGRYKNATTWKLEKRKAWIELASSDGSNKYVCERVPVCPAVLLWRGFEERNACVWWDRAGGRRRPMGQAHALGPDFPRFVNRSKCCHYSRWVFFPILWRSSTRIFSQIWQYFKCESGKILSILLCCGKFLRIFFLAIFFSKTKLEIGDWIFS
jgi:hypothetical protein